MHDSGVTGSQVDSQQRQTISNRARLRQSKQKQESKNRKTYTRLVVSVGRINVLFTSLHCSLSFSSFVQVSLHAAVLLVSRGLSVRRGFVTTTAWMGERVTSLRGTSQCAAVWQNILETVVYTVSPAPITWWQQTQQMIIIMRLAFMWLTLAFQV